jgi:hypothetical protein
MDERDRDSATPAHALLGRAGEVSGIPADLLEHATGSSSKAGI